MFYVSCSFFISSLFLASTTNLQAVNIENHCHSQFPGVTEDRANKLMGLAYEAVDAANKSNITLLRNLLFTVKREVEGMMKAQVKLDKFVDDAFWQAENKGGHFTESLKKQCKRSLGISEKGICDIDQPVFDFDDMGDIANLGAYLEYKDQPHYDPPVELKIGLYLVIIGGLVAFIPFPGCAPAGIWTAEVGGALMVDACVQGCKRQEIDIRQRPIGY